MRRAGWVWLALLALWGAAPAAATLPIGDQFRVSNTGTDGATTFSADSAAVAFNTQANEYLVVWHGDGLGTNEEQEVFGQRLSATGGEIGGDFRVSNTGTDGDANRDAETPAVTYNASSNEYLVVWRADGLVEGQVDVFGQRLSATGAELGGDFPISASSPGDVENPSVAHNPQSNEYLVAWNSDVLTDNKNDVFGQRLSAAGGELGANDFRISTTGADRDGVDPSVAHNSQANEYLVAWEADGLATDNEHEIFGQLLSGAGADLGGDLRISNTGTDGDATHDASTASAVYSSQANEYLVVWDADGLATATELEIFGQRLSPAGAELGGDFRISTTGTDGDTDRAGKDPVVVSNPQAGEYLVAWEADALATDDEVEIFGQRLSTAGAELGGDFRISTAGTDGDTEREALSATAAYNSQVNEYLVAWETDSLPTDDEQEIFARRSGAGPLPSAPPLPVADAVAPSLADVSLSRKRFRVGRKPTPLAAQRARRAKAGTRIRYRLSEDARVTFKIERKLPGRRKRVRGKLRCVKPTPKLVKGKAKRCKRLRRAGVLTRQAVAGANSLVFSGRVRTRALRPGKYRVTLKATDTAGNASRSVRRNFTIVPR